MGALGENGFGNSDFGWREGERPEGAGVFMGIGVISDGQRGYDPSASLRSSSPDQGSWVIFASFVPKNDG